MLGAALLLAFEDKSDIDRHGAGHSFPGPASFNEGHDLALVVASATRHDRLASVRKRSDARFERRRLPQIDRVDRLHVVVTIEDDALTPTASRKRTFGKHNRM